MEELKKLKDEYTYCDCVEFIKDPVEDKYIPHCDLYRFDLQSVEDCANCKINKQ